jgi:DNA primase
MSLPDFSNTPTFFFSYHFFEALPFIKATKKVYIVEGFFDVIQSWNHGIKNVIGTIIISNEMSKAQIDIFKRNNIQIIVIPDNDKNETGIKAARKICKQLKKEQISCQLCPIKKPYNETCKDVDDLLKQHGTSAFYESFT